MNFRPYNDEATCDRDSNGRQYPKVIVAICGFSSMIQFCK